MVCRLRPVHPLFRRDLWVRYLHRGVPLVTAYGGSKSGGKAEKAGTAIGI